MKIRCSFLFFLILSLAERGMAQELILKRVAAELSPAPGFMAVMWENPALNYWSREEGTTTFAVLGDFRKEQGLRLWQEGEGGLEMGLDIHSWNPLNARSRVWGEAGYRNGQRSDVRWNETSDFRVVYPYVMADTMGGDMKTESYLFRGGYAREQKRWTWGVEAGYRAAMEYRKRDPRPRNVVSDLDGKAGAGIKLGQSYVVGLTVHARKYKQTNEVRFYNESGVYQVFHMSGLGVDYTRFSGTNNQVFYTGRGYGGGVELYPRGETGIWFAGRYGYFGFEKILTNLNDLVLNEVREHRWKGELGWKGRLMGGNAGIRLEAGTLRRQGTENLFGDAAGQAYQQIGSVRQYACRHTGLRLAGLYERSPRRWSVMPWLAYRKTTVSYASPVRRMGREVVEGGMTGRKTWLREKQLFHLEATILRLWQLGTGTWEMEVEPEGKAGEMLRYNAEVWMAQRTGAAFAARWDFTGWIKGKVLFVEGRWQYITLSNHSHGHGGSLRLGLVL